MSSKSSVLSHISYLVQDNNSYLKYIIIYNLKKNNQKYKLRKD